MGRNGVFTICHGWILAYECGMDKATKNGILNMVKLYEKKRIVIQNIADTHFGFGAKRQLLIALNKEPKTSREEVTKWLIYHTC